MAVVRHVIVHAEALLFAVAENDVPKLRQAPLQAL